MYASSEHHKEHKELQLQKGESGRTWDAQAQTRRIQEYILGASSAETSTKLFSVSRIELCTGGVAESRGGSLHPAVRCTLDSVDAERGTVEQ